MLKQQSRGKYEKKWVTDNRYLIPTVKGLNKLLEHLGYKTSEKMKQSIYLFRDGNYRFWEVTFATGRQSMLIRVPEDTAPLVTMQHLRKEKEAMYLRGHTEDRLQDPIARIVPASDLQVKRWLESFGAARGFAGWRLGDNGSGTLEKQEFLVEMKEGTPF